MEDRSFLYSVISEPETLAQSHTKAPTLNTPPDKDCIQITVSTSHSILWDITWVCRAYFFIFVQDEMNITFMKEAR